MDGALKEMNMPDKNSKLLQMAVKQSKTVMQLASLREVDPVGQQKIHYFVREGLGIDGSGSDVECSREVVEILWNTAILVDLLFVLNLSIHR